MIQWKFSRDRVALRTNFEQQLQDKRGDDKYFASLTFHFTYFIGQLRDRKLSFENDLRCVLKLFDYNIS